jgi:hypothetical protein
MRYANSFDLSVTVEGMTTVTFKHVTRTEGKKKGEIVETVELYEPITMLTAFSEQMLAAWAKTLNDSKKPEGWKPPAGETATNGEPKKIQGGHVPVDGKKPSTPTTGGGVKK